MPGMLPSHAGRRNVYTPFPHVEPPPLNRLLAFADKYLPNLNPPAMHIRAAFSMSPFQYQAFLIRAIDDPAAWAMYPRLMRALEERRAKSHARRQLQNRIVAEGVRP